jgi:hypothetical protein
MTGRASGDARHSSIAAIAAMVGARVPGADIDRLIGQITALELLPHHADGLLTYLEAHPDALTAGDATAPSALRRLWTCWPPITSRYSGHAATGAGRRHGFRTAKTVPASAEAVTGVRI